jgi:hypothetical protein
LRFSISGDLGAELVLTTEDTEEDIRKQDRQAGFVYWVFHFILCALTLASMRKMLVNSTTTQLINRYWSRFRWHAHLARVFTGETPVPRHNS